MKTYEVCRIVKSTSDKICHLVVTMTNHSTLHQCSNALKYDSFSENNMICRRTSCPNPSQSICMVQKLTTWYVILLINWYYKKDWQLKYYCLPSGCGRKQSLATAVADHQHTLKGVQGWDLEWLTLCSGKIRWTSVRYFQKTILWAQFLAFHI